MSVEVHYFTDPIVFHADHRAILKFADAPESRAEAERRVADRERHPDYPWMRAGCWLLRAS